MLETACDCELENLLLYQSLLWFIRHAHLSVETLNNRKTSNFDFRLLALRKRNFHLSMLDKRVRTKMSVDGLVLTRQGVFGIIILSWSSLTELTAVRQGARAPSTDIVAYERISLQNVIQLVVLYYSCSQLTFFNIYRNLLCDC